MTASTWSMPDHQCGALRAAGEQAVASQEILTCRSFLVRPSRRCRTCRRSWRSGGSPTTRHRPRLALRKSACMLGHSAAHRDRQADPFQTAIIARATTPIPGARRRDVPCGVCVAARVSAQLPGTTDVKRSADGLLNRSRFAFDAAESMMRKP